MTPVTVSLIQPSFRFHYQVSCFIDCHLPAASVLLPCIIDSISVVQPRPFLHSDQKPGSSLCFLSSSAFYILPISKPSDLLLLLNIVKNVKKLSLFIHTNQFVSYDGMMVPVAVTTGKKMPTACFLVTQFPEKYGQSWCLPHPYAVRCVTKEPGA